MTVSGWSVSENTTSFVQLTVAWRLPVEMEHPCSINNEQGCSISTGVIVPMWFNFCDEYQYLSGHREAYNWRIEMLNTWKIQHLKTEVEDLWINNYY